MTTGTKLGRPKRPPVGSLGKLVTVKWHVSLLVSVSLRSLIIVSLLLDALESGSVLFVAPCE